MTETSDNADKEYTKIEVYSDRENLKCGSRHLLRWEMSEIQVVGRTDNLFLAKILISWHQIGRKRQGIEQQKNRG